MFRFETYWLSLGVGVLLGFFPDQILLWIFWVILLWRAETARILLFALGLSLSTLFLSGIIDEANPKQNTYEYAKGMPSERTVYQNDRRPWSFERAEPTKTDAILEALLQGSLDGFEYADILLLSQTGLLHLFIISGLHIAIFLFLVARLLSWNRKFYRWASLLLLFLGGLFWGYSVSVFRALLTAALIVSAPLFWSGFHRYSARQILSVVGLVHALLVPEALVRPGYYLSYGLTGLFIYLFQTRGRVWEYLFLPPAFSYLILKIFGLPSLSIQVGISPVFSPLILFGLFPMSLASLFIEPLKGGSNFVWDHFFSILRHLYEWEALRTLSLGLFLLVLIALAFRRRFKVLIALALLFLIPPLSFDRQLPDLQIQMIDVGQGDALRVSAGRTQLVFDGGGPRGATRSLYPHLSSPMIDEWWLTHFDQDHRGNFQDLALNLRPLLVRIPRWDYSTFSQWMREKAIDPLVGQRKTCVNKVCWRSISSPVVRPLRPVTNRDSLGVQVWYQDISVFTGYGDLVHYGERRLRDGLETWVLKVSHHGSKTSTRPESLERWKPRIALISSGRNNRYNHPHQVVLERLELYGVRYFRTDALGTVNLDFDF